MKKRMFFKTSLIVLLSAFRVQELPARSPFGVTKTRIDPAISSFTVEDFTGDGVPDFAGADPGHSAIRIYQGNPDGTFDYLRHERTATKCSGLSSGDLNGDGIADLVLLGGSGTTPFVVVELGTGNARPTGEQYHRSAQPRLDAPAAQREQAGTGKFRSHRGRREAGNRHHLYRGGDL